MLARFLTLFFSLMLIGLSSADALAACGGTVRTWDSNSGNVNWSKSGNWSNNNIPNTTGEDAVIQAAQSVTTVNANYSIGCVEVTSGELNSADGFTLTINGDYYRAINLNSVVVTAGHNFTIDMAGTAAQTLESVDPLNNVTISNSTNVTFTDAFEIRNTLSITGTGTTLYIQDDLLLSDAATTFTIPSGVNVEVQSGATLSALGGLTVNGTLTVKAGASLVLGSGETLSVPSGGLLKLEGASGNIATLKGNGSNAWNMSVAGDLWANYFRIDYVGQDTLGINVTGTIQKMDNGEFHFISSAGYAMTWGASASIPASMASMSFFDDNGHGNNGSIDASSYNVSDVAISNWAGLGCTTEGCANENDGNNRVNWGSQAGVALTLSTNNNTGKPADPITAGAAADEVVIFAFALNQTATTTDISSITFSLEGTAKAGDVDYIAVYRDNGSCQTQGAQIGSNLTFTGSPATTTLNISTASDLQVSGTTPDCIHVHLATASSAENAVTVGVSIAGTGDVTNSQGYTFSATSGPKVSGPLATISGDPTRIWNGQKNTTWADDNNWTNGTFPTSANNCRVGAGVRVPALGGNRACQNLDLISGGEINWGANDLAAFGTLTIASGFTFTNAGSGTLTMGGINAQSLTITEPFPGTLIIDNSSPTEIVSVDGDSFVTGNLTITDGTLSIPDGITLEVGGNISIASGAKLDIQPGGILELTTDNATITVSDGGSLELVGTSSKQATILTDSSAKHYSITVGAGTSGNISAQYYTIQNGRITVSTNATIDTTNDLSNGTFSCPDSSVSALTINQQVNGDDLDGMAFSSGGCSPTAVVSVDTTGMVGTGVALNMTNWSGDLAGDTTEAENVGGYDVTWGAQSNTIKLTQEATRTNASADQGTTQNMGRWGFQQNAGAGFTDADITSLKVTLIGSGSSNDVSAVRIFEDSDCDSAGGTQIGSGTFSGFPATVTFTGLTTTVPAGASPAMMCIYVEYDIANFATNAATVGAEISANIDVVNDQTYALDAGFSAPVNLGTLSIVGITTNWTGATDSNWSDASNWSSGEPTSSMNCVIPSVAGSDPIITGTEVCKTLSVTNGNLTINAGGNLQLYGSFISTGTYSNSGTLTMMDNGVDATNQTISNSSGSMAGPTFNKTAGGTVKVSDSTMTFSSFSIASGNTFEYQVPASQTLTLSGGATITSAEFTIQDGGIVELGSGQSLTLNGGDFKMDGTAEAPPMGASCGTSSTDSVSSCYTSTKATLRASSGTYSFTASAGSEVYLNGFVIQDLDTSGLNMTGTSALTKLDGGQFESLSTTYASTSVIQLNNSGTNATSSANVAFNWEDTIDNVSGSATAPTPANTAGYYLVSSTGCGSQTIDFTGWTGDFYEEEPTFDITTVVNTTNCNVNFNGSASAVSLVGFTATPYNGEVDLEWETAFEQDHEGFNVFRSDEDGEDFIQINPALIRNSLSYVSYKGQYRFVDEDVTNGQTYYYYIQDVDIFGNTELHGPRIATPLAGLGAAPTTGGGVNDGGSNADDGETPVVDPGTIPNPSYKDLGDGVQILSQTSSSLRIKIVPPTPVWSTSSWNGSFEEVSMSSYSKTLEAGKPELLKRVLLIEVHTFATSASLTNQTLNQSTIVGKNIHPAPDWVLNGSNVLVPSYAVDNTFYILSQFKPDNFIEVDSSLTTIGGRKFLKITVNPLLYNPVSDDVKKLDDVVLDIGIDGDAWDVAPPNGSVDVSASIVANTLRVDYNKEGVFEITYDEMASSNVEGPFAGEDPAIFRLYQGDTEIPMQVVDSDSVFNSGDKIRFYTRYFESSEDTKNQVTLATADINGTGNSPKRMVSIDGNPTSLVITTNDTVMLTAKAEQNNDIILDESIGEGIDHFYWRRIYAPGGVMEYLDMPISMPSMNSSSDTNVEVSLTIKGRYVDLAVENEYTHHLGIYVNGSASTVGEVTFKNKDMQTFTWSVPASYFSPGANTIRARALGTYVSGGQLDHMYVDKVEVLYPAIREASNDVSYFSNPNKDRVLEVDGFSSTNIDVYDVSSPQRVGSLSNGVVVSNDGGSTFEINFFADASLTGYGKRYFVIENSNYYKPIGLSLTSGYQETLLSSTHHADLLIIGPKELTDRTSDLVAQREGQGLDVKVVTLDQVYAEFSNGRKSSEAIKEFVNFTQSSWTPPYPKYLLFLGDATYDPKDNFGYLNPDSLMPMNLVEGRFVDFASDNWFASSFESYLPNLAVGRIPTHDPVELEDYINKMLDYENGVSVPTTGLMKLNYIAGEELFSGDSFSSRLEELENMSSRFASDKIDRTLLGSDAATNTAILNRFNNDTPFMMTYMGHGAFNQWGSLGMFDDSDASALSNSKLPIVMGMNCDNTFFYDVDMSWLTLGETLILNKNGGAIAFIGANTQTTPTAQMYLAKQFNRLLIEETNSTYHYVSLGDLLQRSKIALGTDAYSKDIVRSMTLFGDPSMPLPESLFAPPPPPSNPSQGAAGGGCSAVASENGKAGKSWPEGLLEIFFLLGLGWSIRKLQKKLSHF